MRCGTRYLGAGTHKMNVSYFQSVGTCGILGFYRAIESPPDIRFALGRNSEFIRFQEQHVPPQETPGNDKDATREVDAARPLPAEGLGLADLPLLFGYQEWGNTHQGRTVDGLIFRIAGTDYNVPGLGTHARSILVYDVSEYGDCVFTARVGRDEESRDPFGRIKPRVLLDGEILFDGPALSCVDPPVAIEVPVHGRRLSLVILETSDGINGDHADWLEPTLKPRPSLSGTAPRARARQP